MLREINEYLEECLEVVKNELGILEEALEVGKTFDNGKIRAERSMEAVTITDLRNAGKRGKKVDLFSIQGISYIRDSNTLKPFYQFYKSIATIGDYNKLLKLASKLIDHAEKTGAKGDVPRLRKWQKRGQDIPGSGGVYDIFVRAKDASIRATNKGFSISRINDVNGEVTTEQDKASIKKFYKWLHGHKADIERMTYNNILLSASKSGVRMRSYYSNN